jgi:MtrB/PioB family decaheme-associated outer membrane protein
MSNKTYKEFNLLPIAAAVLMTCSNAYAQTTPETQALISPDSSSISVGVGGVNSTRDAIRFGQYTGLDKDTSALVDFEVIKRNEETGALSTLTGRNLGLDTRELSYSREKQGDWKYVLDYNEIVRNDPYIINTGMTGIGTNNPTINLIQTPTMPAAWATVNGMINSAVGVAGVDVDLQLKRKALGFSGYKWISPGLQLELSFKNEDKNGARMFGRAGLDSSDMLLRPAKGTGNANGGWALLLTPEPIDSTIKTIEGKLNYSNSNLALTGGYYGSFYTNNFGSLTANVPTTLNRGVLWNTCATAGCSTVQQLASSAVALPPDNQAHQFYVDGTYGFTPSTRGSFKVSYTHATQDENYVGMGLTPGATAPANLGGVVDTTLAQVGLTTRPTKDLSVNASLRYEDRSDKTPVFVYNTNGVAGNALNNTTNWPSGSQTRTTAKVDGIYRLTGGYTASLGMDWERKNTPLPIANTALFNLQVLFRESLDEYGLHGSLRKTMSESLNGAVSFEYKQRRGDDNGWYTTTGSTTAPNTNQLVSFNPGLITTGNRVLPDMYMDRDRTKLRGNLDWDVSDKLALQAVAEHGQDDYLRAWAGVVPAQLVPTIPGARTITNDSFTLDATYKVSETWRLNGYWTRSENRWNVNKASLGDDTKNTSDTFGLGIKGKVNARLSVGMDILVTQDVTSFNNVVATSNVGGLGNIAGWVGQTLPGNYLPNINYNTTKLNIFGIYEVDKKSAVKVSLVHQKFETDDWQWGYNGVPFVYSDNTTVSNPNQSLTFLGVSYQYKF